MKVAKTMLIAGIGIGAGMVAANFLTDGAVFEAVADFATNVKDRIVNKTQETVDTVTEVAEDVVENVVETATEAI